MAFFPQLLSPCDIVKRYRFHAAHRNPELRNKCSNIHGHTYNLVCTFRTLSERINPKSGITLEFGEIDRRVEAILSEYDHSLLLHDDDTLLPYLQQFPEILKICTFPHPTSAERLALHFLERFLDAGLPVLSICLMETPRSGVKVYNRMLHLDGAPEFDTPEFDTPEQETPALPQYGNNDVPDVPNTNGERLAEVISGFVLTQEAKQLQSLRSRFIVWAVIAAVVVSLVTTLTSSFIFSLYR